MITRYNSRGRHGHSRQSSEGGSHWLSFSDLMSALLLVFILIMFYSVYQYFDMLEIEQARYLRQSEELADKESELALAQAELDAGTIKLSEAETLLASQLAEMLLNEKELEDANALLALQQKELEDAQAALSLAQITQDEQQALLAAQQSRMDDQQARLDKLVGVRAELIEDVVGALRASEISGVSVDETGAIIFDSEMMFALGRSELNERGQGFLRRFIPAYLKVLMSEEYSPYVSQIIIEGHTDTIGSFDDNMDLSYDRASAVLKYVTSDEFTAITNDAKDYLQSVVSVNGRSFNEPVYVNGQVDMDASRRVVIKFRLNDEQMVEEMLSILSTLE